MAKTTAMQRLRARLCLAMKPMDLEVTARARAQGRQAESPDQSSPVAQLKDCDFHRSEVRDNWVF